MSASSKCPSTRSLPDSLPQRETRAAVAARGLFWGAVIGGFLGYAAADEGDYMSLSPRLEGLIGGVIIGAPLGMIAWLLLTPL